jgi:hypothetical protein
VSPPHCVSVASLAVVILRRQNGAGKETTKRGHAGLGKTHDHGYMRDSYAQIQDDRKLGEKRETVR